MYDSSRTLERAERNVGAAVDDAFAAYLRQVRRDVLGEDTVTADASPADLPPNLDAWPSSNVWIELVRRFIAPAIAAAFGLAFDTAARADLHQFHRYQQTFMDQVFDRLSASLWPDTAFEAVRGDLAEGLDAGESIPQLRERVGAALGVDRFGYLAERIARTEAHTATEGGSWSAHMAWADLSGEELYQLWDSTRDGRTRLTHQLAHNQIVPLGGRFLVGGASLAYPGDPTGLPQEVINCRCSTLVGSRDEVSNLADLSPEDLPVQAPEQLPLFARSVAHVQDRTSPLVLHPAAERAHRWTAPQPTTTAVAAAPSTGPKVASTSLPSNPTRPPGRMRVTAATTAPATPAPSDPGDVMTETVAEPAEPVAPVQRLFWRAAMVPLDTRADYRIITSPKDGLVKKTSLSWLKWQERTAPGHDAAVAIGRADRVWVEDGWLWGEGEWDLKDPDALRVIDKIERDFAGTLSVDLRDGWAEEIIVDRDGHIIAEEDLPDDFDELYTLFNTGQLQFMMRVHDWRFEGVTLVQSPAYYTSRIWIVRPEQGALTAAATGDETLPLADRDRDWDGDAAKRRLADAGRLNAGCFWRTDDADPDSDIQNDYKLPFADIVDGELMAVPAGIMAVANVLQGGMGGVDLPEDDRDEIRDRVEDYYEHMAEEFDDPDLKAPWEDDDDEDEAMTAAANTAVLTAAAGIATETTTWAEQVAANIPMEPPAEWFTNPELASPTKVRVTDHGRVYGHIATWDTNHVGFPGQSVRPPRSQTSYAHFQRNRVRCADGTTVWTGTLVMGTGHADTRVSSSAAAAHYDDTGYAVADVVCGEDETGIWFSGCLKPGASPLQVLTLDRYSVSGDWRQGELVGVCVVNVPGFPISENELSLVAAASGGGILPTVRLQARYDGADPVALVASGVIAPARTATAATVHERVDLERLHQRLDEIPAQVYTATVRAQRESAELAELARQVDQDAFQAMAEQMGVV
ncbi:phage minor head protein [Nocardiopsis synnemataformans]|uniref:phage minor head protein n=1 Tax=Nocardiopsis synnemataformans TaxID=61305 RepID=UPI003EC1284D